MRGFFLFFLALAQGVFAPPLSVAPVTVPTAVAQLVRAAGDYSTAQVNRDTYTVGTGGVTAGQIVGFDSSGNVIAPASASVFGGVAAATQIAGGSVQVVRSGDTSLVFDGAAVVGNIAVPSSTTLGQAHDSGLTSSSAVPAGTPVVGLIRSTVSAAGSTGIVRVHGPGIFGGAVGQLINSYGVTYLYESGQYDTYTAHTLHIGPPAGNGQYVQMTSNVNSINCALCVYGTGVGLGTTYSQLYLNTAAFTGSNRSFAMYLQSAYPNSNTVPSNSDVMFSSLGQSMAQAAVYGWSASATGAGTANSPLSFRTQLSNPSAGTVSCDTTSKGNGACTLIAGLYQESLYTPASSSATCTAGQFADDANYHYVCTAANTWKRAALAAF